MRDTPPIGIVCGSGIELRSLLDRRTETRSFSGFPQLPETTVSGHDGCFIVGECGDVPIILQCGRLHLYEGHSFKTITTPTEILKSMGVEKILHTNAAGGLKPEMMPGDLLLAKSLALWPCIQWSDQPETILTDLELDGCDHVGTYTWVHGPCYETQAEIHALRVTGSDVVGMSTAPEIIRCRELGIQAASISCITNNCCSPQTLTHEHVVEIAAKASHRICEIIRASLPKLAQ